jgi:prepilin-type N-terminal cleavage/methylation domain-containing protein
MPRREGAAGFTLIELSIVLVIIGLIVGGVLTGQDLIRAAEVRATISQIEKYNTAVNTFYGKYQAIPGNMNATTAATFGFSTVGRTGAVGYGSGNGIIESYDPGAESIMFWVDLSSPIAGGLIDGSFTAGAGYTVNGYDFYSPNNDPYAPPAKIGHGNYVWVYSGGMSRSDGMNYFSLMTIAWGFSSLAPIVPSITVSQAYNIDKKMDDGLPQSGNVGAFYSTWQPYWAAGNGLWTGANPGTAATPSAATCYDNGGNASNPMQYSLSTNSGAGPNCALSLRFQ